jgi:hypothetical protein
MVAAGVFRYESDNLEGASVVVCQNPAQSTVMTHNDESGQNLCQDLEKKFINVTVVAIDFSGT